MNRKRSIDSEMESCIDGWTMKVRGGVGEFATESSRLAGMIDGAAAGKNEDDHHAPSTFR